MENLLEAGHNAPLAGVTTEKEVADLNKALYTGGPAYSDTTVGNFTQGQVFQQESLESTLKVVSDIEKQIYLFNRIGKAKAFQLVEEFDLQQSHGSMGSAWISETDDQPAEEDASYSREFEVVKYMGVKKKVGHVMTQIRSAHGDVVAKETRNGVSWLLKNIERAMIDGNGYFAVEGAGNGAMDGSVDLNKMPSWNGLEKQLKSGFASPERKMADFLGYGSDVSHVLDAGDQVVSPEDIEEVCRTAMEDLGSPDTLCLSPKAHSDFSRQYFPKERFNDGKGNIIPGTVVPAMNTSLGSIKFVSTRFFTPKDKALAAADKSGCLLAPASVTPVNVAGGTDLEAGTYYYVVKAINKLGEGVAAISAGIPVLAGDMVNVSIAPPMVFDGIIGYAVYRGVVNSIGACSFIGKVKAKLDGSAVFCDKNLHKPGSSQAFLLQFDEDTMVMKQLTPMMKIDFAIIGMFHHWAQVFYGTPIVFKPNYNVMIENIKQARS